MDLHQPTYIQMDNGNPVQLNNIYIVDSSVSEMWFLLNPVDAKISCDVLRKLMHSNKFKIIYHVFQSVHKEIIDFETPQKVQPIYDVLKLNRSKDCLR